MNQFIAAGALAVITLMLWGIGKKPKFLLDKGFDGQFPINHSALVQPLEPITQPQFLSNSVRTSFKIPVNSREKIELIRHLKKLIKSLPNERLIAVEISGEWGDPSVIPILKIGLRDMDSRVVIKAAKAMSKFRNKPIAAQTKKQISYPLNVFLMR